MKEIEMLDLRRLDPRSLAEALEDHSSETSWWFDPQSGEVEPRLDPLQIGEGEQEDPRDRDLVLIEPIPSREAYGDMEDFIGHVRDTRARDLLKRAIAGRGAFRRFKDTLLNFPDLRQVLFAFHDAREDQEHSELGVAFDPVEITTAAAEDLRALYGARLRRLSSLARGLAGMRTRSPTSTCLWSSTGWTRRGRSSGGWMRSSGGTHTTTMR
jgi:Uncharacterised protein family (UPF0158)